MLSNIPNQVAKVLNDVHLPTCFMKITIGIISYNEGENLRNLFKQVFSQLKDFETEIFLLDVSDEKYSIEIASDIISKFNTVNLESFGNRKGKVHSLNTLFKKFLLSKSDILIHFDADLILHNECISHLIESVKSEYDVVSPLSVPLSPHNFFERALAIMQKPLEFKVKNSRVNQAMTGHGGAYSRRAIKTVFPLSGAGVDEELQILYRTLGNGLNTRVDPQALVFFRLTDNIQDYIFSVRRVTGKIKSFTALEGEDGKKLFFQVYKRPEIKDIVRAVSNDPLGSILVPFVFTLRIGAMASSQVISNDTWIPQKSTKHLNS